MIISDEASCLYLTEEVYEQEYNRHWYESIRLLSPIFKGGDRP